MAGKQQPSEFATERAHQESHIISRVATTWAREKMRQVALIIFINNDHSHISSSTLNLFLLCPFFFERPDVSTPGQAAQLSPTITPGNKQE